jgi:hypothetical protein
MSAFELPFELASNHLRTLFELCASHTPPYPPYSSKGEFEPPSKGVHSPPNFYEGFFLRFSFHALSEFARRSGIQGRAMRERWMGPKAMLRVSIYVLFVFFFFESSQRSQERN